MDLKTLKERLTQLEPRLAKQSFAHLDDFAEDRHPLRVTLTSRLYRQTKKGRVWKSRPMLTALKNAEYGFDPQAARSRGGRDGLFLLDRTHTPPNEMMRKLFDRYLDRAVSGAVELAGFLGVPLDALLPVRLVSHHLRLLGLLHRGESLDHLVLVDFDATK